MTIASTDVLPATKNRNVVVCGYPKSGTTWLSGLIAELLPCPLVGALGFQPAAAREGHERASEYDCYTSHNTFASLASGKVGAFFKLIYIIRDPRDVAISAAHHFEIDLFEARQSRREIGAPLKRRANRAMPHFVKRHRTINAVLHGDPSVNCWLAPSWREHYRQFRQSDALIVRYEARRSHDDMGADSVLPRRRKIEPQHRSGDCEPVFRDEEALVQIEGLTAEYEFIRRGSRGYWREELTRREKQMFVNELGDELAALSYAVD